MQMLWNTEYPNKTGYYYGRAGNTNTSARVERAPHADKCTRAFTRTRKGNETQREAEQDNAMEPGGEEAQSASSACRALSLSLPVYVCVCLCEVELGVDVDAAKFHEWNL